MKRRRFFLTLRLIFDHFKCMIKLNRFMGSRTVYTKRKMKSPRNYYNYNVLRKKKRVRIGGHFFFLDRFLKLYRHLSPMVSYYYLFLHIAKI